MAIKDRTGQRFGLLVAIAHVGNGMWLCRCDCGGERIAKGTRLAIGDVKSCGCQFTSGRIQKTHGMTNTSTYNSWNAMIDRCYRPANASYGRYGGRGITVCERWRESFENFFADMGEKPTPSHSIDRYPSKNGNYKLDNCRWSTPKEQAGNRDACRYLEMDGRTMILSDWAREYGIPKWFLRQRLNRGMSLKDAVETPKQNKGPGAKSLIKEHAERLGVTANAIYERVRSGGLTLDQAISLPNIQGMGHKLAK